VHHSYYWGEIEQELMQQVNIRAGQSGWHSALNQLVREKHSNVYQYAVDAGRADFAYYADLDPEKSVVLDVGSGWGNISCLLARRARRVISVESVIERIEFTRIRAEQENLVNVQPVQASFLELPVPTSSVDFIVLNGVLEWVGIANLDVSPNVLQRRLLEKLYRCLRPGGALYIGIENRFGYGYFLGNRDHSDLPFTSLMPRRVADLVMRLYSQRSRRTGQAAGFYRTYTYSYRGYKSLLHAAGFADIMAYLVFPDYNHPAYMVPENNRQAFEYLVTQMYSGGSRRRQLMTSVASSLAKTGLQRIFSPCFSIFAKKRK
jgi:ubiquinone/menaquinone biosynthesis C-methylase UbiE